METRFDKYSLRTVIALFLAATAAASAQQPTITPPKIGQYMVGDDYFLANYTQLLDYWTKVSKESDRIRSKKLDFVKPPAVGRY